MRDASCSRDENTRARSACPISWWIARAIGSSSCSMQMSATDSVVLLDHAVREARVPADELCAGTPT